MSFLLATPHLLPQQLFMIVVSIVATHAASTFAITVPQVNTTTAMTFKAGFLPDVTFGSFQMDLLERLTIFALAMDNVELTFQMTNLEVLYNSNLPLIGPDCVEGASVIVNDISYNCSDFDMIVGDYWPNSDRYALVDFTPPWLQTSISTLKYSGNHTSLRRDVTTLSEAVRAGAGVCAYEDSETPIVVNRLFPGIKIVSCGGDDDSERSCLNQLKNGQCFLWVADELVLRRIQADKPSFEMTGEQLERQWLAWPVRRSLDPDAAYLLNKWIYAALTSQTITELYFEYFAKKLCPIGTAGNDCELFCDPTHGAADAAGECVCESSRWTGHDCSIEIPEDVNSIPSVLIAIAYTMLASNIFVVVVCGVWLYWQRTTLQVRVSQPYFLFLVLFGCLVSSLTIVPMAAQDDTDGDPEFACMAMPWLYSVGYSITFGTLFGKIRRVYKLFAAPASASSSVMRGSIRRHAVPFTDALRCIGVVLFVDVVILITWTVVDPLEWERVVIREDQFGVSLESMGYCTSSSSWVFPFIIAAFHFWMLAVACYMCYVARNIPTKFSEHKFVTIAMISHLQIFMVAVPVLIIVKDDPAGRFFVRSVIVWMNDLAVVILIFGNLMYSVHVLSKKQEHHSSEEFAEGDGTKLEIASFQYNSKPQCDEGVLDTDGERTFGPRTCTCKDLYRQKVSSLTSTSRRLSVKSVSFDENVSINEIPCDVYGRTTINLSADDRFAATKGEMAPLKPARCSTGKGTIALSRDSTPNMPKRPAPGTSEVEDLPKNSAGPTPTIPLKSSIRKRSCENDSTPDLPGHATVGTSQLEQVAADTGSGIRRWHSIDSSNANAPEDFIPPPNEEDSERSSSETTNACRLSVDSIPNLPKRDSFELDLGLDKFSLTECNQIN